MSIGLVLKHTYDGTCEICEKIAAFTKRVGIKLNRIFTSIGYARAASELARQGYHAEAKALMMELKKQ
jgi:hypothetical protein